MNQEEPEEPEELKSILLDIYRQIYRLRAEQDALLTMITGMVPESEREDFFKKFLKLKEKIAEDTLLKLEKFSPNLAAELDRPRPLLPPDDENKS